MSMVRAMPCYSFMKGRKKDKDSPSPAQDEFHLYMEEQYVKDCSVCDIEHLERLVTLPPGLCYHEWLATHTISFFEHINLLYGTISEFCTANECTAMTAPYNTQFMWLDEKGKKCRCAAPQYIDYVMTYIQTLIADESVFPTKFGNEFPSTLEAVVKKIHKYLFQVIAHIYYAHFKEIVILSLNGHLNILMKHFMLFNRIFNILDKDCDIMDDLVVALLSPPVVSGDKTESDGGAASVVTPTSASSENKENDKSAENHSNHASSSSSQSSVTTTTTGIDGNSDKNNMMLTA
ncbi:MOB kinase activator 2-like isoform X2 [Tubulanus polymorphus]|uniref:MOB kinase activator 2-like isoform X2 n=1 Tax=Tubulanus polymorphus TaxID=672921 RepID=UPI003DA1F883